MEKTIYEKYKSFLNEIDAEEIESAWDKKGIIFREFWKSKILNNKYPSLTDAEIDEIVLILDKNAKGSTKDTIAVARVMIPQGVWRRLFKEIQSDKDLKELLYSILTADDSNNQIDLINKLYEFNKGKKNSLTGKRANAINTMLCAFNPSECLAIISLNDRKGIIEHYNIPSTTNFEDDSQGKKIVESNNDIMEEFRKHNIEPHPYILSKFFYMKIKGEWKPSHERAKEASEGNVDEKYSESESSFYMEKELENFLIANWDRTELANDYELIEEDGDMVSQQYRTEIGIIDILVKDKKSGQYVIIELKKSQSSDDTIGQLTRYMGWIEEHKSNGKLTKGIIIASSYDKKLFYALKKVKDIEVYTYQIDFNLKEFKN
mgnify:CR=1 FL=1|jgi:hypothetical protein